jgi:DNA polymerase-1
MKIVIDIECNSLVNPSHIWVVVCKCLNTNVTHIFRKVTEDGQEKEKLLALLQDDVFLIGHNLLGYDYPILNKLLGLSIPDIWTKCCDTLVVSKLLDYPRQGHSLEQYGKEFGLGKQEHLDWGEYSQAMEDRCVRDVEICERLYHRLVGWSSYKASARSIQLEQRFQLVVNDLHNNGFSFDRAAAEHLLEVALQELGELDAKIAAAFPPRTKLLKEIHPKITKYGTLNKSDFRWVVGGDLGDYTGDPFSRFTWVAFNPSSHKQVIEVLNKAGWKPIDKTQTHIEAERNRDKEKLELLKHTGWKINETNLQTLPRTAPAPARTLARRILLEARRRTLTEWLGLVHDDGRIHGKYYGIGSWTHRMAHQQPNTANIPTTDKLYGKEMRSLWRAADDKVLVGVDAEGIQLRIFAHYIDDKEFTDALVRGKKSTQTDPHSLNQKILGRVCKSRQDAKRFIYAYLLGAGLKKLAEVLGAETSETQEALDHLLDRYTGLAKLKRTSIPADARRGYFVGLDGREVRIPGETPSERRHLVMSGYLQNGEAVIMKKACVMWADKYKLVNFVHDEWIVECHEQDARRIGRELSESISTAGRELNLRCPLAGEYKTGKTWASTH